MSSWYCLNASDTLFLASATAGTFAVMIYFDLFFSGIKSLAAWLLASTILLHVFVTVCSSFTKGVVFVLNSDSVLFS